jgi:two-component system, response regulator FlrC
MLLMVVAACSAPLTRAAKLAQQIGAGIVCADGVTHAINLFSAGGSADIVLIDSALVPAITDLQKALRVNRQAIPIIVCGPEARASIVRDAIHAGASEYLPVSGSVEELAALIESLAHEDDLQNREKKRASVH